MAAGRSIPATHPPDALARFGWGEPFRGSFRAHAALGREPGRVVVEDRGRYLIATAGGEIFATVSGRLRFEAGGDPLAWPAVGDWVALERPPADPGRAVVQGVLTRRTAIVRRAAGRRGERQVVAANVDVAFVVTSANRDFNRRRLERYLAVVRELGARPVVIVSKVDLVDVVAAFRAEAEASAPDTPVLLTSVRDGRGLDDLRRWLSDGRTAVFLGSSGVGKSSLVNALAGRELEAVSEIRLDDDRGRHTTRRRHLVLLPDGGLVLDTPGMRELGLADADGLDASFTDIAELAPGCRFADCRHDREPGCAVRAAVDDGTLDRDRLAAWRALQREAAYAERRVDALARSEERRRWRTIRRSVARHYDAKYGRGWR